MPIDAESLIQIAEQHLDRTAYRVTDNPFLRAVVAGFLTVAERQLLVDVLDNRPITWLDKADGPRPTLPQVGVGTTPRDLQIVLRDGEDRVGVESVYAFVDTPRFWWIVSFLWCIEVGRGLDRRLDEGIIGFRLQAGFLRQPARSGHLFRRPASLSRVWRRVASDASKAEGGRVVAASTVDLRGFYYSVDARPSTIIKAFRVCAPSVRVSARGRRLTQLLDVAHELYAVEDGRVAPRAGTLQTGAMPLPIGFPSSQILSNLVMAVTLGELRQLPDVLRLAAYADDILVVSTALPDVGESPVEYLQRIGVVRDGAAGSIVLASDRGANLAGLTVAEEKCGTSYSRAVPSADAPTEDEGSDESFVQVESLDPYLHPDPSTDWGGRLRTVLKEPFRRRRVPRELVKDVLRLSEEIRVGIDRSTADSRLTTILSHIDRAAFLELRPQWPELIACAYFAGEADALNGLARLFAGIINELEPPDENEHLAIALFAGLRRSWFQAVAEAFSVAADLDDGPNDDLDLAQFEDACGGTITELMTHARRLRTRSFVAAHLVSMPLAEFTDWTGPLFGAQAFDRFELWAADREASNSPVAPSEMLARAKRFIPLHETCLAIHLWADPGSKRWVARVFEIFRHQPLLDAEAVRDLQGRVRQILGRGTRANARAELLKHYQFKFAVPSFTVSGRQLDALIADDVAERSEIAASARSAIASILHEASAQRADILVLPEWSIPTRQLPSIFEQSARTQTLVVGGGAPRVRQGRYENQVWTGIPLVDGKQRRACLVPPPRQKRYLSPDESRSIKVAGITHAAGSGPIPSYQWRGVRLASLICFEFADLHTRDELRSTVDLLTVSSWNRDWRYFDAVQVATTRDNYCITVCVNTGQYPGTQIMRPSKNDKAIAVSVHGSGHPAVVTRMLDLLPIVVGRTTGTRPGALEGLPMPLDDLTLDDYKALPPSLSALPDP